MKRTVGQTNTAAASPQRRYVNEFVIAETYGVAVRTLRKWRFFGQGPRFYKLGRSIRYDKDEVEQFVRATASGPTVEAR